MVHSLEDKNDDPIKRTEYSVSIRVIMLQKVHESLDGVTGVSFHGVCLQKKRQDNLHTPHGQVSGSGGSRTCPVKNPFSSLGRRFSSSRSDAFL